MTCKYNLQTFLSHKQRNFLLPNYTYVGVLQELVPRSTPHQIAIILRQRVLSQQNFFGKISCIRDSYNSPFCPTITILPLRLSRLLFRILPLYSSSQATEIKLPRNHHISHAQTNIPSYPHPSQSALSVYSARIRSISSAPALRVACDYLAVDGGVATCSCFKYVLVVFLFLFCFCSFCRGGGVVDV